jgi:TetR/AcrR family transcriptional regulator, transcriptional repressor for nem operon
VENKLSKADRTRQFIIETTAGIFNTKGYAGTSMSDITEATGLTKGSIYGNFSNKEEVALAAFDYNYGKVTSVIRQRIEAAKTYTDKLMVYAQVYDQYTRSNYFPVGGCPVLNTAVEADDTNSLLKDRAAKAIVKWKKTIMDLIQAGVEAGEFKEGLDHARIALSIIAMIEGGVMMAKTTNSQSCLDKIMYSVELLISAMKV